MKHILTLLIGLLFASLVALNAGDAPASRPNIVFIFTDDQPQNAMSCMGNKQLKTPNMDRLASEGVLFENSFVTTSICCVSRASILTGQHMVRHGINSFSKPLSAEQWGQTYPMLLREAGYRTAFLGKLAVGDPKTQPASLCLPADKFDLWYGFPQSFKFNQQGRYITSIIEEKATQFIREQPKDKPFLLVLALKEPHGPRDMEDPELPANLVQSPIPRPKTLTAESFAQLPAAIRESRNSVTPGPTFLKEDTKFQEEMAQTYRYISRADITVGRIVKALRDKGCDDNTVILFASDNGSMEGAHRLVGKWNMYEESLRVPLIIRDPRLPASSHGRRNQMALNIDLAPTMLALAGLPIPAAMQGSDLQPILRDAHTAGRADWYYEHDVLLDGEKGKPLPRCEGVRSEHWKYIRYKDTKPLQEELFDLQKDPLEEHNLAQEPAHATTLTAMSARCDELRKTLR
jgi:arylsulfatase A-like enzyme